MKNKITYTTDAELTAAAAPTVLGAAAVAALVGVMQGLPKFAEGGIVSRPTIGLFGEAGPEAIIPLDKVKEIAGLEPRNIRVQGEIRGKGKDLVTEIAMGLCSDNTTFKKSTKSFEK